MDHSHSRLRLKTLADRVHTAVDHVSIRGADDGQFLYAMGHGRAVEASINNGRWWVEFWERSDDDTVPPVREVWAATEEDVLRELLMWLSGPC